VTVLVQSVEWQRPEHLDSGLDDQQSLNHTDEAFRLLRHTSQTQHVKLHEVAERLLAAARDDRRP